ncbi:MAG TPA: M48 family metalloprotease [Thermoanaerobaculia bacterium]|nr:M48 family metalloprotease [Thermoanaerobaculia bacterium]
MKAITIAIFIAAVSATPALAQFGDILGKVNRNRDKIMKGAKVAREATKEFTDQEEVALGRVVSAQILAAFPLSKNDRLQNYVTLVGNTVAAYSSRSELPWHFAVVETPTVNAFSAPGGYVFITTGAMSQVQSEAELAAILGHEIAHTTERHILKEIKRANVISAGTDLVQSQYGAGQLTDELAQKVGKIAIDKLFKTGIGRREEFEADRVGVALAGQAGYKKDAFLTFLKSLSALEKSKSSAFRQLAATHPKPQERDQALRASVSSQSGGQLLAERWQTWNSGG